MTKNVTRVVLKPPLKNDSQIIKKINNEHYKSETELSKEARNLKSTNSNAEIAWKII